MSGLLSDAVRAGEESRFYAGRLLGITRHGLQEKANVSNALLGFTMIHPSYRTNMYTCMYPNHETNTHTHTHTPSHTIALSLSLSPSLNSLKTSPATRIASAGKPAIFATFSA
jgi:hypothetical protein